MHIRSAILPTLISVNVLAQKTPDEEAQPVVEEGIRLYKSEMASWHGTDLFLERYKDRENISGYFSYVHNEMAKCVFFSKLEKPTVIGTIMFDSTYNTRTAIISMVGREFTDDEKDLYEIRRIALQEIQSDSLFRFYQNTNLNLIPLVNHNDKRVYVLTGPAKSGVVIFGNDYLLRFDQDNKLIEKKQLHQNIIPVYYGDKEDQEEGKQEFGTMHAHLPETGDFITATDICTLLLYARYAKWEQHIVVSEKYMNIWNCKSERLTVIPRQ